MDEQNPWKVAPEQFATPKKPSDDYLAIAIPLALYAIGHISFVIGMSRGSGIDLSLPILLDIGLLVVAGLQYYRNPFAWFAAFGIIHFRFIPDLVSLFRFAWDMYVGAQNPIHQGFPNFAFLDLPFAIVGSFAFVGIVGFYIFCILMLWKVRKAYFHTPSN